MWIAEVDLDVSRQGEALVAGHLCASIPCQRFVELLRQRAGVLDQRFDNRLGFFAGNLEEHLHRNGTQIIKFFLHLSKEEQLERFLNRIDEPDKNWKFSLADIKERQYWKQYMTAYESCLSATSTKDSPWYVVPADSKKNARLIISTIIVDTFKKFKMQYPATSAERRADLMKIRERLVNEGSDDD